MSVGKAIRLSQVAGKLNVGRDTIIEFLGSKGIKVDRNPNAKITSEHYEILAKEFASSLLEKEEADNLSIGMQHHEKLEIENKSEGEDKKKKEDDQIMITNLSASKIAQPEENEEKEAGTEKKEEAPKLRGIKVLGKIDLAKKSPTKKEEKEVDKSKGEKEDKKVAETKKEEKSPDSKEPSSSGTEHDDVIDGKADKLKGLKVLGSIELPKKEERSKPVASSDITKDKKKRLRKRIVKSRPQGQGEGKRKNQKDKPLTHRQRKRAQKEEPSEQEIQEQIKATLAKLSGGSKKSAGAKYRREKRSAMADAKEEELLKAKENAQVLQVTEYISANDLASLMNVSVNDVISACLNLGMFVSINQRLDAEAITVIADEFGFNVEFTTKEEEEIIEPEEDQALLEPRAPIVTIMGHVDHGKTSLLDYIRHSKVTSGEAGGITQHIGAYDVTTESGNKIAFLDTPGHEAFTAMRARGAKITDVVIIVIAADDNVMPQTKEAINHSQVAGVPMIFAINKIDRPNANPEKIKEELSNMNILVEDWGGKYQSQEISAKTGDGVEDLLEKVLLETELLELKANANKKAVGTVIEATVYRGRGYVTTIMVQSGTLHVGDVLLAGSHFGKVKAMLNHKGEKLQEAGPSTPVQVLGLDGATQAGELFKVLESEREAREVATKREQINREQSLRTRKHITLDEIGRRLAIGSFKELNVIVKGDVDGSIEALSDSLLKLSTDEIQVNVVHKGVGQISESDVLLASASDAVIIGFQVRPSASARNLADTEDVEIRLYSVIYDAINEVKDAMEGMLAPDSEEVIVGNVEIREVFKISKVGTVAGCMVTDGNVKRSNDIRLIRDGIVVYSGEIGQLKRFKDDVQEVKNGYECGLSIKNFNDIKVGDVVESYEVREVKRTL